MDAAGVALGVIPIAVKLVHSYRTLSDKIEAFCGYTREIKILNDTIRLKEDLFRDAVRRVHRSITRDPDRAESLLFSEEELRKLGRQLSADDAGRRANRPALSHSFGLWNKALEQFHTSLADICRILESFVEIDTTSVEPLKSSGSSREVAKRFRFCWKENGIQKSINALSTSLSDFIALSDNIARQLDSRQEDQSSRSSAMPHRATSLNSLERYRQIRHAACSLYQTFSFMWPCTGGHPCHTADIAAVDISSTNNAENRVQFEVAIDCHEHSNSRGQKPVWVRIATLERAGGKKPDETYDRRDTKTWITSIEEYTHPLVVTKETKKRNKLQKKTVRFNSVDDNSASRTATVTVTETSHSQGGNHTPIPDMVTLATATVSHETVVGTQCTVEVCPHFTAHMAEAPIPSISSQLHQFRYLPLAGRSGSERESLLKLLDRRLLTVEKMSIINGLANAILQYHGTSWLPDSWASNDVHLFETSPASTPFFRVQFPELIDKGKGVAVSPEISVRNQLLFSFAIVLLELGYNKPWSSLERNNFPANYHNKYDAAQKLSYSPELGYQMGKKFPMIIRKCLGCDFGLGETNLANEELQEKFFEHVVNELGDMCKPLLELARRMQRDG